MDFVYDKYPTRSEKIERFLNILRSSNYYNDTIEEKHLEWLFEAEETATFVDWFCTYIGQENILKQEEINEYLELMSQCAVTSEFDLLTTEEVTQQTIASLENEILEIDTFLTVLDSQEEILRSLKEPCDIEEQKLQEQYKFVQKSLQNAEQTCIGLCKKLDSTNGKAMECVLPMNIIFQNSLSAENADSCLFLHMSITDLKPKYDRFQHHTNLITSRSLEQHLMQFEERLDNAEQQMFVYNSTSIGKVLMSGKKLRSQAWHKQKEITEVRNKRVDISNQFITKEIKELLTTRAQYWWESLTGAKSNCVIGDIEKQENMAVLEDILELTKSIEAGLFQPSQTVINVQLMNYLHKLENLSPMSLFDDILICIKQLANTHVIQNVYKLSEAVKNHLSKIFECQQTLLQCTETQSCHCYLFLILIVIEKLKLEDITQLSHSLSRPLYEDLEQLNIRRENMKMIRVDYDARHGKELCMDHSFPKMLLQLAPPKTSYQQLFDVFKEIDDSVHKEEYDLYKNTFSSLQETFNVNIQSLQELEKIIFTGTTKKPVLMDLDISCQLYDIEMVIKGLHENLEKTIAECVETKKFISKKPSKYRRLLWVYFLTNCKKIVELIEGMECVLLKMEEQ